MIFTSLIPQLCFPSFYTPFALGSVDGTLPVHLPKAPRFSLSCSLIGRYYDFLLYILNVYYHGSSSKSVLLGLRARFYVE